MKSSSAQAAETEAAETEAAETEAAGPVEAPPIEQVAHSAAATGGTRPSRSMRQWVVAAVLGLVLAVAGYEGWLLFAQHQKEVAAAQALAAAEKYTTALTSVDLADIDKNFAEVLAGATGDFKDKYAGASEQLRQLLIANKAAAHGTVVESAVKSATKNKVEVMLFVDQSVSNKAVPEPQLDRSRIVMTMEKVDGQWLAGQVDLP